MLLYLLEEVTIFYHSHFSDYVSSLEAKRLYTDAAEQLKRYLLHCKDPRKERFMRESLAVHVLLMPGDFSWILRTMT